MANNDDGNGFITLLLIFALAACFLPIGMTVDSTYKPKSNIGKILFLLITIIAIGVSVASWCLHWPIWVATIITIIAGLLGIGRILSLGSSIK